MSSSTGADLLRDRSMSRRGEGSGELMLDLAELLSQKAEQGTRQALKAVAVKRPKR